MRKFTLLIAVLVLCSVSYGQKAPKGLSAPVKGNPEQTPPPAPAVKGGGDVFWSTTFGWKDDSNPQGWTLPAGWNIVDNADLGNYWKWMAADDTVGGCCSGGQTAPRHFVSRDDGCIFVPADPYNNRDGITVTSEMDTHITTPPIDCSSKSTVVVKFNQYFRLCCNEVFQLMCQVTNDNGVHWATYDCRFGMGANIITPRRYLSIEFNISDVAANLPNVQLRFYMKGPKYYYWMIDDLALCEAYDNNLALEDYWADANVGAVDPVGNINYWPLTQMGMDDENGKKVGAYNFRGAILNMGTLDQNDQRMNIQILRNGTEVLNQNSETKALWSLERDTLTLAEPWLADDYGLYDFSYTVLGDVPDEFPKNNTAKLSFTVNDTLYHRADFTTEATSGGGGWVGGNNAGDMVGVGYDLKAPAEINSIYARLGGITAGANTTTQFVLVKDMGDDGYIEYIMSDVVEAQDMGSSWQTLTMVKDGETEFLEPGFYIACVRMWGEAAGDADGINGMSVGWDTDTKWNGQYSFLWRAVAATWWSIDKLNQIGIVLNTPAATSIAGLTFNVDLNKQMASGEFKPGTDLVDVVGLDPTWEGTLALTDTDGDGIYTGSIENLTVAKYMKYSYRINGVREGEPKFGYLERTYRISYWNILADTYNNNNPLFIFNVDMSKQIANGNFKPGIDTLEVKGLSGTWWRSLTLKDDDNDGIYSAKLTATIYYGTEIQYKYRINSAFESYPLTGDPYRKRTVKYWNYLDDIYNEGSSSVNPSGLADTFSVYPNPTQGAFKVAVTSTAASDLTITLTNIQGQVVYQNRVANTSNHQETIDTKMSKGIYFLTVNNGKEVKVQKVIVQ